MKTSVASRRTAGAVALAGVGACSKSDDTAPGEAGVAHTIPVPGVSGGTAPAPTGGEFVSAAAGPRGRRRCQGLNRSIVQKAGRHL